MTQEFSLVQSQLSWIINVMGPIIAARSVTDLVGMEIIDAELSSRIFQLISFNDTYVEKRGDIIIKKKLEISILNFLTNFRKVYIGDHARSYSDVKQFF